MPVRKLLRPRRTSTIEDGGKLSATLRLRKPALRLFTSVKAQRLYRWFSVTMGTGIVSILLHNLPYNGRWLYWISVVIFALNVGLFVVFTVISLLRYILYPEIFVVMLRHPGQSVFVGTFPMGLATIINMIVFVCVPAWGGPWPNIVCCRPSSNFRSFLTIQKAWGLWWFDAAVSVLCCFSIPFAT